LKLPQVNEMGVQQIFSTWRGCLSNLYCTTDGWQTKCFFTRTNEFLKPISIYYMIIVLNKFKSTPIVITCKKDNNLVQYFQLKGF
jgi:hypothetical protein